MSREPLNDRRPQPGELGVATAADLRVNAGDRTKSAASARGGGANARFTNVPLLE